MSRKIKEIIEGELSRRFKAVESGLLVDVSKLTGVQANVLRGKLRAKGIQMHVVKNRLAKRVLGSSKMSAINQGLTGPCAVVTGGSSMIEVARELVDLVKEFPTIVLKGGVVDGEPDYLTVEDVSKRRSRLQVIGDVLAAAAAPGRKLSGAMRSPGGKLAGCIQAIVDKLEKGETIQRVA